MVGTVLYNLFFTPIEYIIEIVFSLVNRLVSNPGVAIIAISVVVSVLCLPLYKRADAIQDEEREKQDSMSHWINHIKKTFKGDERYMMLLTYYRQQNYKPISSLKGSISLLLQIPFFVAAYHYLSNLTALKGASFWIFNDLGEADGLIQIGSFSLNVMPIIMTAINVFAAYIYLKGFPMKQKIQTYALAAIFLVLLYNRPSGLVIYWTCNQIFSLIKNIFLRLVKSKRATGVTVSALGIIFIIIMAVCGYMSSTKRTVFIIAIAVACQIPLVMTFIKKSDKVVKESRFKFSSFLFAGILLTIFLGAIIPLSVISSSPSEFVTYSNTPSMILAYSISLMAGFFLVWVNVFYYLATPKARDIFMYLYMIIISVGAVNYFFFGKGLGYISEFMVYDDTPVFTTSQKIINIIICAAVAIACCLLIRFFSKFVKYAYLILIAGAVGLVITHVSTVNSALSKTETTETISVDDAEVEFTLSKNGQNIVLFMLDRTSSIYLPYIFNEQPQLYEQFDGFTYYPNTISFGGVTCVAAPALFGGYDYMPSKMNERDDQLMIEKHNEAEKVIPAALEDADYECTLIDPSYAGSYTMDAADMTIFDDLENTTGISVAGKYITNNTETLYKFTRGEQNRNIFFYSIMKAIPLFAQNTVYDSGNYYTTTTYKASTDNYIENYSLLEALPNMTGIEDSDQNKYVMIDSMLNHSPSVADPETYEPTVIDEDDVRGDTTRFILNGIELKVEEDTQIEHYNSVAASLILIGKWLQYLKDNDLYDNTRIIICADHAVTLKQLDSQNLSNIKVQRYNPLLLVKDFNSTGTLVTDESFMTNADVPSLCLQDVVENPVNKYTGNPITMDSKYTEDLLVATGSHYNGSTLINYHVIGYTDNTIWYRFDPYGSLTDSDSWEKTDIKVDAY